MTDILTDHDTDETPAAVYPERRELWQRPRVQDDWGWNRDAELNEIERLQAENTRLLEMLTNFELSKPVQYNVTIQDANRLIGFGDVSKLQARLDEIRAEWLRLAEVGYPVHAFHWLEGLEKLIVGD